MTGVRVRTLATPPRRTASAPVPLGSRARLLIAVTSLVGLVGFAWPFLLHGTSHENAAHASDAPWLFAALLPLLLAIVLAELSDGSMDAKAVALLGVLGACGTALRLPGGISGFEPVFFLLLPAGRVFGKGFGFVLGALTIFASAIITGGVGPWLPFQMLGAAWVGFGAGCLPRCTGKLEIAVLAAYGFVAGLVYGMLLNLWFWPFGSDAGGPLAFVPGASLSENLRHYAAFYVATSFGWDLLRGVTNVVLVVVAGRPVLGALHRVARKAAFGAPVVFGDAPDLTPNLDGVG